MSVPLLRFPFDALVKAIVVRLKADLAPVLVTDFVEEGQAFPYVRIGELLSVADGAKNLAADRITVTIHAFSEYEGQREVNDILNKCITALSAPRIDLSGDDFDVIRDLRYESAETLLQRDEKSGKLYRHGALRVQWVVMDKLSMGV